MNFDVVRVNYIDRKALVYVLLLAPFFYAMTLMWWLPEGDKYLPGTIVVGLILFSLLRGWQFRSSEIAEQQLPMLLITLAVTGYCALIYVLKDGSSSELRALIASSLYMIMSLGFGVRARLWKFLLVVSATSLVIMCFWQWMYAGVPRAHGFYNPIPFATALAVVLVACFYVASTSSSYVKKVVYGLLALLLFLSLLMTGTRGVIVAVVSISAVWLINFVRHHKIRSGREKIVFLMVVTATVIIGGILAEKRFQATSAEIERIQSGEMTSSIGIRLQLWELAGKMIKLSPAWGLGKEHQEILNQWYDDGRVSNAIKSFQPTHYHNQYIEVTVKRGMFGLLLFLTMLLIPVFLYRRRKNDGGRSIHGLVPAVVTLYMIASLTDVPFNHPITIYMFLFPIYLVGLPDFAESQSRLDEAVS